MSRRISMRWMVTLFTGFFLAISLGTALVGTLGQVQEQWVVDSAMHASTAASLLAHATRDALADRQVSVLNQLAAQTVGNDTVERVIITDPAGKPLADSTPREKAPALLRGASTLAEQPRVVSGKRDVQVLVPVTQGPTVLGMVFVRYSMREHQRLLEEILQHGIGRGLIVILAGCLIAYAAAGLISQPLCRLAQRMGEIARGQLAQEVAEDGCREMRHMARSFNRMSSALQRRASEMQSLSQLSLAVSRSLELGTVVRATVESVERALPGTRVQIWLPDYEREHLILAGAEKGADSPESIELPGNQGMLARAFHLREAVLADGPDAATPIDPQLAERTGASVAIAVPLSSGADAVGVLFAFRCDGGPISPEVTALAREDLPFLSAAANEIALAIQNARLYGRQERMASIFHRLLLPASVPGIEGLDVAVRWRPSRGEGSVGGDFYDFIALPNGRWGIAIGDVCGKGVLAASYTTMAKHVLRTYASEVDSPAEILQRTNAVLFAQLGGDHADEHAPIFITILCAIYDPRTGRLIYSHAGHPLGTLARPGSHEAVVLNAGGPPVGIMPDTTYAEQVLYLAPGDTLALYTDGVVESARTENTLEPAVIAEMLAEHQEQSVEDAAESLMKVAMRLARGRVADDIALLVLRARGDRPPVELPPFSDQTEEAATG